MIALEDQLSTSEPQMAPADRSMDLFEGTSDNQQLQSSLTHLCSEVSGHWGNLILMLEEFSVLSDNCGHCSARFECIRGLRQTLDWKATTETKFTSA
jgi:hypothetical protein